MCDFHRAINLLLDFFTYSFLWNILCAYSIYALFFLALNDHCCSSNGSTDCCWYVLLLLLLEFEFAYS